MERPEEWPPPPAYPARLCDIKRFPRFDEPPLIWSGWWPDGRGGYSTGLTLTPPVVPQMEREGPNLDIRPKSP